MDGSSFQQAGVGYPTASFTQPSSFAAQFAGHTLQDLATHGVPSEPSSSNGPTPTGTNGAPAMNLILTIRLLMQGKEVGSIIGKRGDQIKAIREDSGAKINISDGSCPERIVTITGSLNTINRAFAMICNKFQEDMKALPNSVPKPPITMRMIVPATQCGSLIGKGGSKIKEIREATGASIQVASEMLPSSTERAVTLSGTADAIILCMKEICNILIEAPPKGATLPYRPKPTFNPLLIASSAAAAAAQQQAVAALLQPYQGQPIMTTTSSDLARIQQNQAAFGGAAAAAAFMQPQLSAADTQAAATSYANYFPVYGGMIMAGGDASSAALLGNAQFAQQWEEAKKLELVSGLGQYAALNSRSEYGGNLLDPQWPPSMSVLLGGAHLVKGTSPPSKPTSAGSSATRFQPY